MQMMRAGAVKPARLLGVAAGQSWPASPRCQHPSVESSFTLPLLIESERTTVGRNRQDLWKPADLPSLRHHPGHWRSHVSTAAPCSRMFAEHGEGGGGPLWAAEVRPGCNGVAGGCVRAADPGAVAAVSADAGGSESRSGSAGRSDSLIEFVKSNVAILPLLILTATTGSDRLSYGVNDTAGDGFWIGSNLGATGG